MWWFLKNLNIKYSSFNDRCSVLWVSGPVLTTLEEFENGGFTLKTHHWFSSTLSRKNLKTQQTPVILDLCLRKTRAGKSHDYRDAIVSFDKLRFQNVFRPHENETPPFSNYSGLKSVFEKLRFRDGLVWTVGLTVEIKLRFQISPA